MDWVNIPGVIWSLILYSLPKILLFSMGLLILSIILIIVLSKFGLLNRKNKYWHWAIKIYYLYIPIVFICFGIACGCLSSTKSYINKKHNEYLGPVSVAVVTGVVTFLSELEITNEIRETGITINDFVKETFGEIQYQPKSDSLIEKQIAHWCNEIIAPKVKWVLGLAVRKTLEDISSKFHLGFDIQSDVINFGDDITVKLNFSDLDENLPDILTATVHTKIQDQLSYIYWFFIQVFLMFLLLPFLEILIYSLWVKKRYESV